MFNLPRVNTRGDVDRLIQQARDGELRPYAVTELKRRLEGLLNDQRWTRNRELGDTEEPADGAKVIEEDNDDGTTTRVEYVQVDDPGALRHKLGCTRADVESFVTELEGLTNG